MSVALLVLLLSWPLGLIAWLVFVRSCRANGQTPNVKVIIALLFGLQRRWLRANLRKMHFVMLALDSSWWTSKETHLTGLLRRKLVWDAS